MSRRQPLKGCLPNPTKLCFLTGTGLLVGGLIDMLTTRGYAVTDSKAKLKSFTFNCRELAERDVLVAIDYCGVSHSDIHQAQDDWGTSLYPLVPGHEIIGHVAAVGDQVTRHRVNDVVGVGCLVNSCRCCSSCLSGEEQYCCKGPIWTYNNYEYDKRTLTYGGYASQIVVDQDFALKIPADLDLAAAAPLLGAGITVWSPLLHWGVGKGYHIGIVGFGGLGHLAVKFAAALGAEVTVFSTSLAKASDAQLCGAHHFINSKDPVALQAVQEKFDIILSTVSSDYALEPFVRALKIDGSLIVVGLSGQKNHLDLAALVNKRRSLAGSLFGGLQETQEMLDFCGQHNLTANVEVVSMENINQVWLNMLGNRARYRYVIDVKNTLH